MQLTAEQTAHAVRMLDHLERSAPVKVVAPTRLPFASGQVWRERKPVLSFRDEHNDWTIVAITQHSTSPVVAQDTNGCVREFGWSGRSGGDGCEGISDLDLVRLIKDCPDEAFDGREDLDARVARVMRHAEDRTEIIGSSAYYKTALETPVTIHANTPEETLREVRRICDALASDYAGLQIAYQKSAPGLREQIHDKSARAATAWYLDRIFAAAKIVAVDHTVEAS